LILNQFQDGFRRNRSTNTALSEAMDFFYNSLNGKRKTVALFYDLSRAFDTVNHELLLRKLYGIGVRGVHNDWIKSYLQNRTLTVVINDQCSTEKRVTVGIPQGSLLGPVLFIIFINDIIIRLCGKYGKLVIYMMIQIY
jgi:retron-type reverse transcriptase